MDKAQFMQNYMWIVDCLKFQHVQVTIWEKNGCKDQWKIEKYGLLYTTKNNFHMLNLLFRKVSTERSDRIWITILDFVSQKHSKTPIPSVTTLHCELLWLHGDWIVAV